MLLRTLPDGHKDTPGGQGRHKSRLLGRSLFRRPSPEMERIRIKIDSKENIYTYIYIYSVYTHNMKIEMSSKLWRKTWSKVTPSKNNFKMLSHQPAPVAASVQSGFRFHP